jgi:hypothetical protein
MRERAAAVIGAAPVDAYLDSAVALERWTALDRLDGLQSRTLMIASEYDYTPLLDSQPAAALAVPQRSFLGVWR